MTLSIRCYILDDDGEPVLIGDALDDVLAFAEFLGHADRQVADDTVGEGVRVSTVFLGVAIVHGDRPPLLWETMIFGGPLDGEQHRYATRAAALDGHRAALARACQIARLQPTRNPPFP